MTQLVGTVTAPDTSGPSWYDTQPVGSKLLLSHVGDVRAGSRVRFFETTY